MTSALERFLRREEERKGRRRETKKQAKIRAKYYQKIAKEFIACGKLLELAAEQTLKEI